MSLFVPERTYVTFRRRPSPSVRAALDLFCAGQSATFLNGSQTVWELPHTVRSSSCFQLRLQGDRRAHQSHRRAQASGQFNFLKPQRPFFFFSPSQGGVVWKRGSAQDSTFWRTGRVKAPRQDCSLKVSFFSFLLNVNSHVSLSPSISEYPPKYKIGIILSSHPVLNATNNTFVYRYSQTERTVDGGRYLFIKRWVKDRFTLGMWSNYCLELPTKRLGV